MSFLVRLPQDTYREDALNGFTAVPGFTPENAKAMMWLSQLAYETDNERKVDEILKLWKLEKLGFGRDAPTPRLMPPKARFIVAAGRGATFVTFSGTDPLSIRDWITDFTLAPMPNAFHKGFVEAVDAVRSDVELVIRSGAGRPLFFTGHSMGGALANVAALRARDNGLQATAVYTFGGPRTGGQDFFDRYTPDLGGLTFRLVNDNDIVPAVPPSLLGNFRHVGQMQHCRHGAPFAGQVLAPKEGNGPSLIEVGVNSLLGIELGLPSINQLLDLDPRHLDQSDLPVAIRDHVPASYFRALGIRL
jgi:triacylglycerol lipase